MPTKEESAEIRNKRIELIQPLLDKGFRTKQISDQLGINRETVRHIVRNYCKRPELGPNYNFNGGCLMDWQSELDPSTLNAEQRENAKRFGISEGRYAWLLSCPRINSPFSHAKHG